MSSLRKKLKETERLRKEAEDEAKDPYEKAFENVINKAKRGKLQFKKSLEADQEKKKIQKYEVF